MVITHYGLGMVKIQQGDMVIVFNPIGESKIYKPVKFGADIALVSLRDPEYNGIDQARRGDRVPFVIEGPGEYEVSGIFIKGIATSGPGEQINTVYSLLVDGIRLVHLGIPVAPNVTPELVEELGIVDLLFVPVGGGGAVDAKQAGKAVTELEPKVVIPINFDDVGLPQFLKELGRESVGTVESLTLKRKDIVEKQAGVSVVKSW